MRRLTLLPILFLLISTLAKWTPAEGGATGVRAIWKNGGKLQELKYWTLETLSHWKQSSNQEQEPGTRKRVHWQGVLLSEFMDHALEGLTADQKAQIDLVILKDQKGIRALIPRFFIVKYPILLALKKNRQELGLEGPLYSRVSGLLHSKVHQENLPVEFFSVPGLVEVEFSNYREKLGDIFLKRRTDPAAVRGEKIFVQNCASCHAVGHGPSLAEISRLNGGQGGRILASMSHPEIKGSPQLSPRDWRSLESYWLARGVESH